MEFALFLQQKLSKVRGGRLQVRIRPQEAALDRRHDGSTLARIRNPLADHLQENVTFIDAAALPQDLALVARWWGRPRRRRHEQQVCRAPAEPPDQQGPEGQRSPMGQSARFSRWKEEEALTTGERGAVELHEGVLCE